MEVDRKPILQHVVERCKRAANYLNNNGQKLGCEVKVALLCPEDDEIVDKYRNMVDVVEGSEHDVLSRYSSIALFGLYDFVVRITADCLFIPSHIITMAIRTALIQAPEYTTNTIYRTFPEGWDIEVMSRRLIQWLDESAKSPEDREHVTTIIKSTKPFPFRKDGRPSIYHLISDYDLSHIKTSIDTPEDLERAIKSFESLNKMKSEARRNGYYFT